MESHRKPLRLVAAWISNRPAKRITHSVRLPPLRLPRAPLHARPSPRPPRPVAGQRFRRTTPRARTNKHAKERKLSTKSSSSLPAQVPTSHGPSFSAAASISTSSPAPTARAAAASSPFSKTQLSPTRSSLTSPYPKSRALPPYRSSPSSSEPQTRLPNAAAMSHGKPPLDPGHLEGEFPPPIRHGSATSAQEKAFAAPSAASSRAPSGCATSLGLPIANGRSRGTKSNVFTRSRRTASLFLKAKSRTRGIDHDMPVQRVRKTLYASPNQRPGKRKPANCGLRKRLPQPRSCSNQGCTASNDIIYYRKTTLDPQASLGCSHGFVVIFRRHPVFTLLEMRFRHCLCPLKQFFTIGCKSFRDGSLA